MLPLSLSYDHRIMDGADAARFLRWIVEAFEQPFLLAFYSLFFLLLLKLQSLTLAFYSLFFLLLLQLQLLLFPLLELLLLGRLIIGFHLGFLFNLKYSLNSSTRLNISSNDYFFGFFRGIEKTEFME